MLKSKKSHIVWAWLSSTFCFSVLISLSPYAAYAVASKQVLFDTLNRSNPVQIEFLRQSRKHGWGKSLNHFLTMTWNECSGFRDFGTFASLHLCLMRLVPNQSIVGAETTNLSLSNTRALQPCAHMPPEPRCVKCCYFLGFRLLQLQKLLFL